MSDIRSRLAAASDPDPTPIDVPGVGKLYISAQTPYTSARARRLLEPFPDDDIKTGRVLAVVLCDEAGAPVFDPASDDDAMMLAKLDGKVSAAIFAAHRKANALEADEGNA